MTLLSFLKSGVRSAVVLVATALSCSLPAQAHEVLNEIQRQQAVTVTLQYSDGEPFSYETYELYSDQNKTPVQTGRTDSHGRVVFLPDAATSIRLRAFSADGHGVDLRFDVPAASGGPADNQATAQHTSRTTKLLSGLAVILILFAGWQLFVRKKNKP